MNTSRAACWWGDAGQQIHGFLTTLGLIRSSVIIKAILFSVVALCDAEIQAIIPFECAVSRSWSRPGSLMRRTTHDRREAPVHRHQRDNMHIAEQGEGSLVVLCHGFPECWYAWRHQLPALAGAGYHAVAPDQRGYGQTSRPEPIEAYHILQLTGDMVGLVHALGEERAIIVGHDGGAPVAWHCALLRPDMFHAVVLLSVPYLQRSWRDMQPTEAMRRLAGEQQFYQLYFQEQGTAEAELEADVRRTMRTFLYSASGDSPPEKRWRFLFDKSETFLETGSLPETLPGWLSEQDLDVFTREFEQTGFRGGLNWYRNIDRLWELTPFLSRVTLRQPVLFVAGELDPVITMYREAFEAMEQTTPGLRQKILLPGAGHWIQQERPAQVNQLLLEFLAGL